MPTVREWTMVAPGMDNGITEATKYSYTADVPAGATLLRSLVWVTFLSNDVTLAWPPNPAIPWGWGVYQNLNDSGGALNPDLLDPGVDWVATGYPVWQMDGGVFTSTEQDAVWHAHDQADSRAQRKVTDAAPVITVAISPIPPSPDPGERIRTVSFVFWLRQLWQWES